MKKAASALAVAGLLAASCGSPQAKVLASPSAESSATASASAGPASPAATATPTASPTLAVSLKAAFGSLYGRGGGPHCPNWLDHYDNVVLAQPRLTYTATEISRMAAAVKDRELDYAHLDSSLLAVQPGAATATAPPPRPDGSPPTVSVPSCTSAVEVTNAGPSPLQIARAGLRLTAAPAPNQAAYRLVEFCSVLQSPDYCGPQLGGGPPGCSVYQVPVQLAGGGGGDYFGVPAQVDFNGKPCPQVTLVPGASVTLVMDVYSSDPLIYRAVPVLDVITTGARGSVAMTDLAAVYSFASAAQFVCYRLSGTTFSPWKSGSAAYDFVTAGQAGGWCP